MKTYPFTANESLLSAALTALANAQARVISAENQLTLLAEQHGAVQAYLATEQQLQAAKLDVKRARAAVTDTALSQYEGHSPRLHEDVQIAQRADVNVLDPAAALLWLLCYQPESINLDEPEQLRAILRREGLQNKLCLSRLQILATVESLFECPAVKVCGWVAVEDVSKSLWRHVVVQNETDIATARRIVEEQVSAELGERAWCWAQEPHITQTHIRADYLRVSEPISLPFPRIRHDLAHLVTEHPQPVDHATCPQWRFHQENTS